MLFFFPVFKLVFLFCRCLLLASRKPGECALRRGWIPKRKIPVSLRRLPKGIALQKFPQHERKHRVPKGAKGYRAALDSRTAVQQFLSAARVELRKLRKIFEMPNESSFTYEVQIDLLNFLQIRYRSCGSNDTQELLKFYRSKFPYKSENWIVVHRILIGRNAMYHDGYSELVKYWPVYLNNWTKLFEMIKNTEAVTTTKSLKAEVLNNLL